jgi:hypothetical protein
MGGIKVAQRGKSSRSIVCRGCLDRATTTRHSRPLVLLFFFFLFFSLVPVDSAHSCAKWLLRHDIVGKRSWSRWGEREKVYRAWPETTAQPVVPPLWPRTAGPEISYKTNNITSILISFFFSPITWCPGVCVWLWSFGRFLGRKVKSHFIWNLESFCSPQQILTNGILVAKNLRLLHQLRLVLVAQFKVNKKFPG